MNRCHPRRFATTLLVSGTAALLANCAKGSVDAGAAAHQNLPPAAIGSPSPHDETPALRITELEPAPPGLSGLAVDQDGTLWAVSERSHELVSLRSTNRQPRQVLPVTGVPDGLDLESLGFLPDGQVVFGTESHEEDRSSDLLLIGQMDGGAVRITRQLTMSYTAWRQTSAGNQGIEAVCTAGDKIIAIGEAAIKSAGGRAAPLGLFDPATEQWTALRVALSSAEGKMAGATCRIRGRNIEVLAIERHFGVRRILRWELPLDAAGGGEEPITPTVVRDFTAETEDNPEGVDWLQGGGFAVITDNQSGMRITGTTKLLLFGE